MQHEPVGAAGHGFVVQLVLSPAYEPPSVVQFAWLLIVQAPPAPPTQHAPVGGAGHGLLTQVVLSPA